MPLLPSRQDEMILSHLYATRNETKAEARARKYGKLNELDRYRHDPHFHAVVNELLAVMKKGELDYDELKSALNFARVMYIDELAKEAKAKGDVGVEQALYGQNDVTMLL